MTLKDIERAYKAIERHVRKHVKGDALDAYCACCNAFDRLKDGYDKDKGTIEDFAAGIAGGQLSNEFDSIKNRKFREKAYEFRQGNRRGELAEQRRIKPLIQKVMMQLPRKQRIIIIFTKHKLSLPLLARTWNISWGWFFEGHVKPAQDAFAKEFGKAVGNEKWYAELRRQMKIKTKGGAK